MSAECKYQLVDLDSPRIVIEDTDEMAVDSVKRVTRKWEVFTGRNRFYCDGRLMTAPHSGVFVLTVCLITGTSILFFIFDCQYLAENVTVAIPIIGGVLFLFTMSALLRTSLTDPGIIPRATADEAAYVEKQIEVTNSANSPTYRPPPRTKEVLIKGQTVKLKYCFTCKIFRPPRASHCSLCDNCVDRFDHHCPWVGNCVGRRNYRFFYMFIVSLAFLAVFIFSCAIAHLILITREDRPFLEAVKESPASVIVAVVCFFSVWSILGLAGFHTYLTTSNQTTNEDIKGSFTSKRGQESFNPYSQGNICLNCFYILCGPLTPSLIDSRGLVTNDYKIDVSNPPIHQLEPVLALKSYGTAVQNGQTHLDISSDVSGLYRQTTENNGMFKPLKPLLYRTQNIVPSKTCATQKISPTHIASYELPRKFNNSNSIEVFKSNAPLPHYKNYNIQDDTTDYLYNDTFDDDQMYDVNQKYDDNYKYDDNHRYNDLYTRPYTPPEKRYSANFGLKIPERKYNDGRQRPSSSNVYENVHVRDYCKTYECNVAKLNKNDRGPYHSANVKVKNFPIPAFSSLYIQESLN